MKSLFKKLGISLSNENLFETKNNLWKNRIPFRYKKGIQKIKPDYFFVQENKPVIFFFDGIISKEIHNQIWNLGGIPIIYCISNDHIDIFNGFDFDTNSEFFRRIDEDNISILDFFSGKQYEKIKQGYKQVDKELLENLKNAKEILESNGLLPIYAQNIIGRLLFSRFLIDNYVEIDKQYFSNKTDFLDLISNKEKLYNYFSYIKDRFHGDLFPIDEKEFINITETHLNILVELFSGNTVGNNFIQTTLFDKYNFEIIPVELISEVYEQFMGEDKQKNDGAYYTPSFLVDFILEKTVKKHLQKNTSCSVFDPSCGSGIFLVESFRMIVEKNLDDMGYISIEDLKSLLVENIFGVDKNEIAINLTIFSLYLTLLDYVNPKDLSHFTFPNIKDKNLFSSDFFDEENIFNQKIFKVDFVIGNPPWGSNKDEKHIAYLKKRKTDLHLKSSAILVSDNQIAETFILKLKEITNRSTAFSLVLPSKILYNYNAQPFRKYFLDNFKITEILELSPVRKKLFSGAIAPTFIAFFEHSSVDLEKDNVISYTSIKPNIFIEHIKILVIEKADINEVKQSYFIKYDYLWKILLYGNISDFFFIKRLREDYSNIGNIISSRGLLSGGGIKLKDGGKKTSSEQFKGYQFIEESGVNRFHYLASNFTLDKVGFIPQAIGLFHGPTILINKSPNKYLKSKSVYVEESLVFKSRTYGISGGEDDKDLLKTISGTINSDLADYFLFLTDPQIGVEREEIYNETRRLTPFISTLEDLVPIVDRLNRNNQRKNTDLLVSSNLIETINEDEILLNTITQKKFSLTKIESSLVEYYKEVTVPLFLNNKIITASAKKKDIIEYVKIFKDEFGEIWNGPEKFFKVDVYLTEDIVAINFKVTDDNSGADINFIDNVGKYTDIFNLLSIGEEQITRQFYKIRDIRGFNRNSFFVIKYNQVKNWHIAKAYQDLAEFKNAMMISGLNKTLHNKHK